MKITPELLRKRAEHNEGMLRDLEEIALHQQDIEKIELFDKLTRHIKILMLQNNQIDKMENLNKLKELEYLNLALNNIAVIEGIEGCESLNKLDMTCNFIQLKDFYQTCMALRTAPALRQLYLLGNPCIDWLPHRKMLVNLVPQLIQIDGKEITPQERIESSQNFDDLLDAMYDEIERLDIIESKKTDKQKSEEYSREYRKQMYAEMREEEQEKEDKKNPPPPVKKETSIYGRDGNLRQCNEGRYKFDLHEYEDPDWSEFILHVPKYLATDLLDVNLFPSMVSIRVKGKLTQVKLWEEIIVSECKIQRAMITGKLHITMKKFKSTDALYRLYQKEKQDKVAKESDKMMSFGTMKGTQNSTPMFGKVEEVKQITESVREKMEKEKAIQKMIDEDEDLDDLPDLEQSTVLTKMS